jgi:hypothetical protein
VKWAINCGNAFVVYGDMEHTVVHTELCFTLEYKSKNKLCKNHAIILQSGILTRQRLAKV